MLSPCLTVTRMMLLSPLLLLTLTLLVVLTPLWSAASNSNPDELKVVQHVDLNRYVGTWYEIALIPVWFQRDCAGETTAEYTLAEGGEISVINRCCTKEGTVKEAKGRAWVVDKKSPGKLKVSFVSVFGLWLFGGKYWIIDLDPDYQYAVIGNPGRKIGWILSRTPQLPQDVLNSIAERLKQNGYNFSDFSMTNQTDVRCNP